MHPDTPEINSTTRFSDRVDNYKLYRPSYPKEVISFLEDELGLKESHRIADIGSGTGLFAELLLENGYTVVCIEPNPDMRQAAELKLSRYQNFSSRLHRAEQTGLRSNSIHLITVATAFHWMDPVACKKEFNRILKPGGHTVLVWNVRKTDNPFLHSYGELKQQFSLEPNRNNIDEEVIRTFFEPRVMKLRSFPNMMILDFDGLKGQLLSSSTIPLADHPSYETMIASLVQLFEVHNQNGFITMEYETRVYWNG